MEGKELKIFEIKEGSEKHWVCAYTNIQALKTLLNITDRVLGEYDDSDEITEVPKEKWGALTVSNSEYDEKDPDDWESKTFEEYMKDATGPDIIAGTMYE